MHCIYWFYIVLDLQCIIVALADSQVIIMSCWNALFVVCFYGLCISFFDQFPLWGFTPLILVFHLNFFKLRFFPHCLSFTFSLSLACLLSIYLSIYLLINASINCTDSPLQVTEQAEGLLNCFQLFWWKYRTHYLDDRCQRSSAFTHGHTHEQLHKYRHTHSHRHTELCPSSSAAVLPKQTAKPETDSSGLPHHALCSQVRRRQVHSTCTYITKKNVCGFLQNTIKYSMGCCQ